MRKLFVLILSFAGYLYCYGQDIYTRGLVYQVPEMKKTIIKEKIIYSNVNDTALSFDIYYPPGFNYKKDLPLVIFNNGVGAMDIPRWGIYKDWAKLMAANGMIGINYQARGANALQDGEALLDYLVQHAKELNIDAGKIGMWTCSANSRTGMRIAFKTRPELVKALVVYYGGPDSLGQLRQNLPTLLVRSALDAQVINRRMDDFLQIALQQDIRIEMINYLNGIHAFDAYINTDESKEIIIKTVEFFKKNLSNPVTRNDFVLTNKNFMWLVLNGQLNTALSEFRRARTFYRADPSFQPFFNGVIREDILNANAYWLLQNQHQPEALEVFKLMVESYPESPNAYESLSEAFETLGNKEEAIRNAEICLQKLPADSNMDGNFRQIVQNSAEQRIRRLTVSEPSSLNKPGLRAHHELVYDEKNEVVFMTSGSTPLNGGSSFEMYNDVWQFDGKNWKQSGTAGDKRSGIRMAYDSKHNKIYSYGGWIAGNSLAELREMENGEWKTLSNMPEMKSTEAGFVYDAGRDKLIAFGGSAEQGKANNVTWEWNGSAWKKFEGKGPDARQAFAMIYDSERKTTVLYGGSGGDGKVFNDGIWEFDGVAWKNIPTANDPGQRISPGYAYDAKRKMLILFGGISGGQLKNDTWGWNGKKWEMLADSGPSPRVMGYMTYDKKRDRIVMFGGRLAWPNDANDTWEWDGDKWKEIK